MTRKKPTDARRSVNGHPTYHSSPRHLGEVVLTSGQTAVMLKCAPRTVCKWQTKGYFPRAYTIPDSGDRRIPLSDVVAFAARRGIPLPGVTSTQTLIVGFPQALAARLAAEVEGGAIVCPDALCACWEAAKGIAGEWVVAVDVGRLGRAEAVSLAHLLKQRLASVRLIGLLSEDSRLTCLDGYDAVMLDVSQFGEVMG